MINTRTTHSRLQKKLAKKVPKHCVTNNQFQRLLFDAILRSDICLVKILIEDLHVDANQTTEYGDTVLHIAASSGNVSLLEYLTTKTKYNFYSLTLLKKESLLHLAVQFGHLEMVKYLHKLKLSVNLPNAEKTTPLHWACAQGDLSIVQYLVEVMTANISVKTVSHNTLLHFAITRKHNQIAKYLISHAPKLVHQLNGMDRSPLFLAADSGNVELVELLLEHKADPHMTGNTDNPTPFHIAVLKNYLPVMKALYQHDKNVLQALTQTKQTALHMAATVSTPAVVKWLIEHMSDLNSKDMQGKTPLHYAINIGCFSTLYDLIMSGKVDANIPDAEGFIPLHCALTIRADIDVIKLLVEHGNSAIHFKNKQNKDAIGIIINLMNSTGSKDSDEYKNLKIISEYLLKYKLSNNQLTKTPFFNIPDIEDIIENDDIDEVINLLNSQQAEAVNILLMAAVHGAINTLRHLIENLKISTEIKNNNGQTPLLLAIQNHQERAACYLIENAQANFLAADIKQNVDCRLLAAQSKQKSILHSIAMRCRIMAYQTKTSLPTTTSRLPLHNAVILAETGTIETLLHDPNTNVNAAYEGTTALHLAAALGYTNIVKDLLAAGANINALDNQGYTPVCLAGIHDQHLVIEEFSLYNKSSRSNKKSNKSDILLYLPRTKLTDAQLTNILNKLLFIARHHKPSSKLFRSRAIAEDFSANLPRSALSMTMAT